MVYVNTKVADGHAQYPKYSNPLMSKHTPAPIPIPIPQSSTVAANNGASFENAAAAQSKTLASTSTTTTTKMKPAYLPGYVDPATLAPPMASYDYANMRPVYSANEFAFGRAGEFYICASDNRRKKADG